MRNRAFKWLSHACRIVLGVTFIFSGFVKTVDPWGTAIKIQEYLSIYGLESLSGLRFGFSIWLCGAELMMGLMLLFKVRIRLISIFALASMIFFTVLTFLSATWLPVEDCGCFGDAVKLTPWETFAKNLVLLPLSVVVWWRYRRDRIFAFSKAEVGCTVLFFSLAMGLGIYCYAHLPLIDFRPFKVGVNIYEAMNAYSADPGPQAGKTVANRFRLSSRNTSTPSFTAKGQTPPTAWPRSTRRSASTPLCARRTASSARSRRRTRSSARTRSSRSSR